MDLSPGGLLPVTAMSSSQGSLMSPPTEVRMCPFCLSARSVLEVLLTAYLVLDIINDQAHHMLCWSALPMTVRAVRYLVRSACPAKMVNAADAQAWGHWPDPQDSANLSHVSVSTPTAPSAQV
jgi:hypothetical protein